MSHPSPLSPPAEAPSTVPCGAGSVPPGSRRVQEERGTLKPRRSLQPRESAARLTKTRGPSPGFPASFTGEEVRECDLGPSEVTGGLFTVTSFSLKARGQARAWPPFLREKWERRFGGDRPALACAGGRGPLSSRCCRRPGCPEPGRRLLVLQGRAAGLRGDPERPLEGRGSVVSHFLIASRALKFRRRRASRGEMSPEAPRERHSGRYGRRAGACEE